MTTFKIASQIADSPRSPGWAASSRATLACLTIVGVGLLPLLEPAPSASKAVEGVAVVVATVCLTFVANLATPHLTSRLFQPGFYFFLAVGLAYPAVETVLSLALLTALTYASAGHKAVAAALSVLGGSAWVLALTALAPRYTNDAGLVAAWSLTAALIVIPGWLRWRRGAGGAAELGAALCGGLGLAVHFSGQGLVAVALLAPLTLPLAIADFRRERVARTVHAALASVLPDLRAEHRSTDAAASVALCAAIERCYADQRVGVEVVLTQGERSWGARREGRDIVVFVPQRTESSKPFEPNLELSGAVPDRFDLRVRIKRYEGTPHVSTQDAAAAEICRQAQQWFPASNAPFVPVERELQSLLSLRRAASDFARLTEFNEAPDFLAGEVDHLTAALVRALADSAYLRDPTPGSAAERAWIPLGHPGEAPGES